MSNTLGCGFLENVYENALVVELRENGLGVVQQPRVEVLYRGRPVGEYVADMIVERSVVVEVKALASLAISTHRLVLYRMKHLRLSAFICG